MAEQQSITWDNLMEAADEARLEPGGWDAQTLRRISDQERVPWKMKTLTLVRITPGLEVTQAKNIPDKITMLEATELEDLLLVCWPGKWSQDIFILDDRKRAKKSLGI